jgi:glycosyltransferase involved in cell wall biosynthesis
MSRILFLSQWLPFPITNGSKLRIHNLLHSLSEQHAVTLLSFTDRAEAHVDDSLRGVLYRDIHVVPWQSFQPSSRRARLGLFSKIPRSFVATYSPEMANLIGQTLAADKYDLVIASQTTMAGYAPNFSGVPALFEEAELGVYYDQYVRVASVWQRVRFAPTWLKQRNYLASLLGQFNACTVVSEQERNLIKRFAPSRCPIYVVPNFLCLSEYQTPPIAAQPNTLVFTGSFRYFANHDAMVWFLQEILPQIRAQAPDAQLMITGDHANLPLPPSEGVVLKGVVADIRPVVANAWMSIVPLRFGGGTRLKILEAMALRTPVVTTSKGAEGLDARHDEHLLIADTAEDFAAQVIRLLRDSDLRKRLTANAWQLVRDQYDAAVVLPQFLNLVASLAAN